MFYFKLCKGGGYFGKSQFILENRGKRLFEHCKNIGIISQMSWEFQISGSETTLGQIFQKKNFWTPKKISDPFPRENRQKIAKLAKNGIFEALKAN